MEICRRSIDPQNLSAPPTPPQYQPYIIQTNTPAVKHNSSRNPRDFPNNSAPGQSIFSWPVLFSRSTCGPRRNGPRAARLSRRYARVKNPLSAKIPCRGRGNPKRPDICSRPNHRFTVPRICQNQIDPKPSPRHGSSEKSCRPRARRPRHRATHGTTRQKRSAEKVGKAQQRLDHAIDCNPQKMCDSLFKSVPRGATSSRSR